MRIRMLGAVLGVLVAVPMVMMVPIVPVSFHTSPLGGDARQSTQSTAPRVVTVELGSETAPRNGARTEVGFPDGVPIAESNLSRLEQIRPPSRSLRYRAPRTQEFSAVAVTWRHQNRPATVNVAVRVRQEGAWSPWQAVGAEENTAPTATRQGVETAADVRDAASLIWVGPSEGVDLMVTTLAGPAPVGVRLELIDPLDLPTDHEPELTQPSSRDEAAKPPAIFSRAAWGANETVATWSPQYASTVHAVVLHHTATSNNYQPADVPKILRSIFHYHAVSNGWGDIGYNVLVDRFGRLWEGRKGGLTRPVIGAHAGGFNTGTAGIAMIGHHSTTPVPAAVVESVARYVAWKFSLHGGVDPRGSVQLTGGPSSKYPTRVTLTLPRVFPHQATSATECPGRYGLEALEPIRQRAFQLMNIWQDPTQTRTRLAVFRPAEGTWFIHGVGSVRYGEAGDIPVPADYDGDGEWELAVFRPAEGTWFIHGVGSVRYGEAGDIPVPADYDGDGAAEPAVFRPATGTWYAYGVGAVQYGENGDIPVPGTYTNAGRADFAVFRPAEGTWFIHGVGSVRYGEAGDIPVPADYDGDGEWELAVFRPSAGTWFIHGVGSVRYGEAGDIPVPADHNGDGYADPAVWRPGIGTWFILGGRSHQHGQHGDIPVPLM